MSKFSDRIKFLTDKMKLCSSYRKVFCTKDGEEVLQHLMRESGILNPKLTTDPSLLLVRQGEQRVVYSILRMIGKDPIELQKQIEQSLQQEQIIKEQNEN